MKNYKKCCRIYIDLDPLLPPFKSEKKNIQKFCNFSLSLNNHNLLYFYLRVELDVATVAAFNTQNVATLIHLYPIHHPSTKHHINPATRGLTSQHPRKFERMDDGHFTQRYVRGVVQGFPRWGRGGCYNMMMTLCHYDNVII